MTSKKRITLGKGLGALLGVDYGASVPEEASKNPLVELNVTQLTPGKYQPRGKIRDEDLHDLIHSIRTQGILQPILVRKSPGGYEIIAGERRWRSAKLAGLSTVPVIIKEVADEDAMVIALIENIQREDLNALEEAQAIERLAKEFGLTHQQVAEAIGKSRTTVTNLLRLLSLSEPVKALLAAKKIETGHAKVLLSLQGEAQNDAARWIVEKGLSVRESERWVSRLVKPLYPKNLREVKGLDPDVQRLQNTLSEKLGAFVEIESGKQGSGKIVIRYNSLDELDGILAHIQ